MIAIISSIDRKNAIGYRNSLLFKVGEDMLHFAEKTANNVVIMGRKTLESLPKKLDKNRTTIVVSETLEKVPDKADYLAKDLQAALRICNGTGKDIYIAGGSRLYEEGMQYADTMFITEFNKAAALSDAYFPRITREWEVIQKSVVMLEPKYNNGLEKASFYTYKKQDLANNL